LGSSFLSPQRCERFRLHERSTLPGETHPDCTTSDFSAIFSLVAQMIFTVEVVVKVLAFGITPHMYLSESWNKLGEKRMKR
jgi:hypothetical protein